MDPTKKIKLETPQGDDHTIFNLKEVIDFRHRMHAHPEIGFKEFKTQKSIYDFLIKSGVKDSQITKCAQTGYYVDIQGSAPEQGDSKTIALRCDIDALSMTEDNPDLPYKSQTENDHACGHDGHTATMLGFIQLFLEKVDQIPKNKKIRALFQPCEEGPLSGAREMIKEGVLKGVDEVYGYHGWPVKPVGYLMVKGGNVMASATIIRINLIGKGGHGSEPQKSIDPVQMAVSFHIKLRELQKKYKDRECIFTIPVLKGGERFNVIANSSYLEGTMRSLEDGLVDIVHKEFIKILDEVKQEFSGSDYNLEFFPQFDILKNTDTEAEHVSRVAKEFFGESNVGPFILPVLASEDFCYYTQNIPGAFYFLGSQKTESDVMLHNSHYNFNDDLLEPAAKFFLRLVYDRFGI